MNSEILLKLEKLGFPQHPGALMFLSALYFSEETDVSFEDLVNAIDEEALSKKDRALLAREFAQHDSSTGKWKSKYSIVGQSQWHTFKTILQTNGLGVNGHSENTLKYSIWDKDKDIQRVFDKFVSIPNFNLDRAAIIVTSYYQETEFPKKLLRFFEEDFEIAYKTFTKNTHSYLA